MTPLTLLSPWQNRSPETETEGAVLRVGASILRTEQQGFKPEVANPARMDCPDGPSVATMTRSDAEASDRVHDCLAKVGLMIALDSCSLNPGGVVVIAAGTAQTMCPLLTVDNLPTHDLDNGPPILSHAHDTSNGCLELLEGDGVGLNSYANDGV